MKTKEAEALMRGKKVVGTPKAFSGYEDIAESAGWLCKNTDKFVAAMKTAQCIIDIAFDPFLRGLYNKILTSCCCDSPFPSSVARGV